MKTFARILLTAMFVLVLTGCSYIQGETGFALPEMTIEGVVSFMGPQIMAVMGLIVADLILGVAVAMKKGIFDWTQLSDFLQTNVLPKLLGWMAAEVIIRTVASEYLQPPFDVIGPGIAMAAFLAVIGALAGSIIRNFKSLEVFGTA